MGTYIYQGEVNISSDQVKSFQIASEALKIKGICSEIENSSSPDQYFEPYRCRFIDPMAESNPQMQLQASHTSQKVIPPPSKKQKTNHVKSEKLDNRTSNQSKLRLQNRANQN